MPSTPTYPGVYIQELSSGVRTLAGIGTSITAFVGRAFYGPVNEPVTIVSFGEYEKIFGGLWYESTMSYAVYHYFLNGGSQAIIVRVGGSGSSGVAFGAPGPEDLVIHGRTPGIWGNRLFAGIQHDSTDPTLFTLRVTEREGSTVFREEIFYNLSISPTSPRFVVNVLNSDSTLVRMTNDWPATTRPAVTGADLQLSGGGEINPITSVQIEGSESARTGIYALEKADQFNMLVIPPFNPGTDVPVSTWAVAKSYCERRRAMLIVDCPSSWTSVSAAVTGINDTGVGGYGTLRDENAAIYFPRIFIQDPLRPTARDPYPPGGAVAGVIARTDAERGIWKAPAGIDARLSGLQGLAVQAGDGENGQLNPLGVNVLRSMPAAGNVVWGARTLVGADRLTSEWKYLPVRRTALYIEESLYRGTQWVVFEPNDESLWAQIRLNVGAFMHQMFRQGAFQGAKPSESYFVKCDSETTTQNDINQGVVNILVGFAPLKPAEFVIVRIQQMAGQIAS